METSKATNKDMKAIFMLFFVLVLTLLIIFEVGLNVVNETQSHNNQAILPIVTNVEMPEELEPLPTLSYSGGY